MEMVKTNENNEEIRKNTSGALQRRLHRRSENELPCHGERHGSIQSACAAPGLTKKSRASRRLATCRLPGCRFRDPDAIDQLWDQTVTDSGNPDQIPLVVEFK
jgi:hypothetical protein